MSKTGKFQPTPLVCREVAVAELRIVAMVQKERFSKEIKILMPDSESTSDGTPISVQRATKLDELKPFFDEHGLIRMGGRLKKSDLAYNTKHPLLLPSRHHLINIIIRENHQRNRHAGGLSTFYTLRDRFWILNGKNQVRSIIHRCIECIRHRPILTYAKMTDSPEVRVNEAPAFCHTGVDFFGPIVIKEKKDSNTAFIKT